jgi:protein phosphatase
MTLFLRYAAKSDVGLVRAANEDSGFAGRTLLAVADGMGGHAAGELASSTAIATLAELDSEELPTADLLTSLDDAIVTSAERIGQYIDADPSRSGMGTTLTAILWQSGRIAVIHVGDSRAYLLRDGELTQITRDHTYVQSLIDAGRITPEEARRHPKRNLLLRAIDGNAVPEGETSVREAQAGDRYLLCSDGLSGVVDDAAIAGVLRDLADPTAAVTALVDLALEGGAPDNVTAVVADVIEADDEEVAREVAMSSPVVVGAAGERRNREALPGLLFPDDVVPGGDDTADASAGPALAGTLASRGAAPSAQPAPPGSIGHAIQSGALEVVGDGSATAISTAVPGAADAEGKPPPAGTGAGPDQPGPGFVRRHAGLLAVLAVAGVGLLVGLLGFLWWLGSQWYVGVQAGYVTVSQGVPQSLAGIPLSRVTTQTALVAGTLPLYDQQQLALTIEATTQEDAERIVADLEAKAAACAVDPVPLGCPGAIDPRTLPTATPSPVPSPTTTTATPEPAP